MFWADTIGLKKVVSRLEAFDKRYGGDIFTPSPLLVSLAEKGDKISEFKTF